MFVTLFVVTPRPQARSTVLGCSARRCPQTRSRTVLSSAGLDAESDSVGPGIYGGGVQRAADGTIVIGKQYEEHNSLPGPVYDGTGYTEMSQAVRTSPEAVATLLALRPELKDEVTTGGARPLHVCGMSQRGQRSAAVLLAAGVDEVDPVDTWGYTPLMRMATNNLGVGGAALLRAGADRLRPSGLEGTGDSARDLAIRLRSFDVLREIQRFELETGLPLPEGEPLLFTPETAPSPPPPPPPPPLPPPPPPPSYAVARVSRATMQLSSGLTFDDGEQRLISVQRPLGLVLEEREEVPLSGGGEDGGVVVAEVLEEGSAARMGVRPGDVLLAVNNQDVSTAPLEAVLDRISAAPGRVLNLRFARREPSLDRVDS